MLSAPGSISCRSPFLATQTLGGCLSANGSQGKCFNILPSAFRNMHVILGMYCGYFVAPQAMPQRILGASRKHVVMEATGRMGGQVWTDGGDSIRKESGAEASTSESDDDQFGDAQEQYWQEKTNEETDRFLKRQGLQAPDAANAGKGGPLYPQTAAAMTSWQAVGGLCIAGSVGVTGYSLWEAERYRIALKDQRSVENTSIVGVAVPMPLAPRNWAPWQVRPSLLDDQGNSYAR